MIALQTHTICTNLLHLYLFLDPKTFNSERKKENTSQFLLKI